MRLRAILLFVFSVVVLSTAVAQNPVHFSDPNLKAAVEDALWIEDPTSADMLSLRELSCVSRGVTNITGLEKAENLRVLNLRFNQISDISPLSGLSNLQNLSLSRNQVNSLSPLSGLDRLRNLDLHGNDLSNISVLSGLPNLQTLILRFNQLSNISALSELTNLQNLDLHENLLSDISALSGLTNLQNLDLYDNQLSNISVLSGLTKLRDLDLRFNQIDDISALSNLTDLRYLYLGNNDVSTITPVAHLTNLRELYLRSNHVTDISDLLNLTHLQTLDVRWNSLDSDVTCRYLNMIIQNNPGLIYFYEGNCDEPTSSSVTPDVSKESVKDITESSAVLRARVVSDGADTCEGRFRYWITGQSESGTPWQASLHSGVIFNQEIQGLQSDSQYNFVAELKNSAGLDITGTGSFTTAMGQFVLSILSSPGGHVVNPGEGDFNIHQETSVPIMARAVGDHSLFMGWTGTAVDAGAVDEPHDPNTTVLVNDSYTLKANFVTMITYVDDDAPSDPRPYDLRRSDPLEDGSADHPFDSIQEAIADAAADGFVLVRPGTYYEGINLMGKDITVTGIDPCSTEIAALPVIDGNDVERTVTFDQGEGPQCQLSGFVLTRGLDEVAGAIACLGSSPTIKNCLIAGNRCEGPYGAIIYCQGSNSVFENLSLHGNEAGDTGAAFRFIACNAVIDNSILWGNVPREIVVESGHEPLVSYSDVQGGWPGQGNIAVNPEFAMPGFWTVDSIWIPGDYHLMSKIERWDPDNSAWMADTLTSPCIGAGDPNSRVHESLPHGTRINMGVYGGTDQASRSPISVLDQR
jgi:Leucine-rich repeat (LRR) protein